MFSEKNIKMLPMSLLERLKWVIFFAMAVELLKTVVSNINLKNLHKKRYATG